MRTATRTSTRGRAFGVSLAAALLVFTACGSDETTDPPAGTTAGTAAAPADSVAPSDTATDGSTAGETPSGDPLVIGMSLPMTGPVADRAVPGFEGYEYWVEELNANGGLLGRPVELSVLDDQFDQQTAVSDYNRLISQDKVDLVLGTFSSDLNLAVAPVAERFEYVYVEPSGGADEIFERNFKFLFFAQPATAQRLPNQFVNLIKEMPEADRPTSLALVQVDDPNTTQVAGLFEEQLGALGIEVVYNETYAPDTSNFDTIANGIKQAAHFHVFERSQNRCRPRRCERPRATPARASTFPPEVAHVDEVQYTFPDGNLEQYLRVAEHLGIERMVLVQPSYYGTDNSLLMDVLRKVGSSCRGVVQVGDDVSDADLDDFHVAGVRAIRLDLFSRAHLATTDLEDYIRMMGERTGARGRHLQFYTPGRIVRDLLPFLATFNETYMIHHMGYMKEADG